MIRIASYWGPDRESYNIPVYRREAHSSHDVVTAIIKALKKLDDGSCKHCDRHIDSWKRFQDLEEDMEILKGFLVIIKTHHDATFFACGTRAGGARAGGAGLGFWARTYLYTMT